MLSSYWYLDDARANNTFSQGTWWQPRNQEQGWFWPKASPLHPPPSNILVIGSKQTTSKLKSQVLWSKCSNFDVPCIGILMAASIYLQWTKNPNASGQTSTQGPLDWNWTKLWINCSDWAILSCNYVRRDLKSSFYSMFGYKTCCKHHIRIRGICTTSDSSYDHTAVS